MKDGRDESDHTSRTGLAGLAELSHAVERVALALCRDDPDDDRVAWHLEAIADGEREAVAVALSYALRRRELDGATALIDRTIALLAATVRRMSAEASD